MEKLELIISLLGALGATVATAATFIAKFVKSVKAKRVAEQTIEICNALLPFVEQAESLFTIAAKKKAIRYDQSQPLRALPRSCFRRATRRGKGGRAGRAY